MDYFPEGDLFTAILTNSLYLARPPLIKSVFLQILDAVISCHDKQIYLRDLKPENVLVADEGARAYLTDFGLATSDDISTEFKTGSVYHMSPECIGPDAYSPRKNDVWSLGILLLNLVTSRNPWRTARSDDPTFAAYLDSLSDPSNNFPLLPRILPISSKLNALLESILCINPEQRISLRQLRREIKRFGVALEDWYSDDVVFDGGCARCPWEMDVLDPDLAIESDGKSKITENGEGAALSSSSPRSSWSENSSNAVQCSIHHNPIVDIDNKKELLRTPLKRLPRPIPSSTCSAICTPSASTSYSSAGLPKTPRDLVIFSNLKVIDPDTSAHVGGELEQHPQMLGQDTTKESAHDHLGPSFLPHRLFERAAGLFSRS